MTDVQADPKVKESKPGAVTTGSSCRAAKNLVLQPVGSIFGGHKGSQRLQPCNAVGEIHVWNSLLGCVTGGGQSVYGMCWSRQSKM